MKIDDSKKQEIGYFEVNVSGSNLSVYICLASSVSRPNTTFEPHVTLKDRIRNTIIRQRTRVTDIVQYVTNRKWKCAGHIARMKDNRWTIRSTEWQIKGVRSVGSPKRRWRDDIVGQQGAVWTRTAKDRERWRTLAEGYFLQWKDTA